MNEKLLEIYEKCMKHKISISVSYLLSDVAIRVAGVMTAYDFKNKKYEILKCEEWVSIHEMKRVNDDNLIESAIDKVVENLNNRKDKLNEWHGCLYRMLIRKEVNDNA